MPRPRKQLCVNTSTAEQKELVSLSRVLNSPIRRLSAARARSDAKAAQPGCGLMSPKSAAEAEARNYYEKEALFSGLPLTTLLAAVGTGDAKTPDLKKAYAMIEQWKGLRFES